MVVIASAEDVMRSPYHFISFEFLISLIDRDYIGSMGAELHHQPSLFNLHGAEFRLFFTSGVVLQRGRVLLNKLI